MEGLHIPLRLGVCHCITQFHGQLEGQEFGISSLASLFQLQERLIGNSERVDLRMHRCHFFLDAHKRDGLYRTALLLNILISNGAGRGWRISMGGAYGDFVKSWHGKELPTPQTIVEAIPELILRRGAERFPGWLATMTPDDWTEPG